MLGTLALTQSVGTVALIQNSIVQTYAEEKNKDVTSQQFLDYIKELQQKQQLEQSIKQYEDIKKQSKDEYDAKVNKYNQDVATYNQAKQE